jgi:uncharacterized protein YodC (DUF2158 family)
VVSGDEQQEAQAFKIGDVVVLKSGGPRMTVTGLRQWHPSWVCDCAWFGAEWLVGKKARLNVDSFNQGALERVTDEDDDE